jgi:hypothetical protein
MTLDVTDLHDQLAERAFLHDDPDAYLAGVRDTLDVLVRDLAVAWEPVDGQDRRGA